MISVIIPTLNAAAGLARTLDALIPATRDGLIKEVILADGGSTDETTDLAEGYGARMVTASPGRGQQLREGAAAARAPWLLFLHADTALQPGWESEAHQFLRAGSHDAAVFTLAFDSDDWRAGLVALGAKIRTQIVDLPYGDQGLLISRSVYDALGGYAPLPLFEDVDMIKRIRQRTPSKGIKVFASKAITSPVRYEQDGYVRRVVGNMVLLMRFQMGASADTLVKAYR